MPEFRIEPMPSRSLKSDKVVYYVRSRHTNQLVTKFDTNTQRVEDIEGWVDFTATERLELQNYLVSIRFTIDALSISAKLNRDYRLILPEPLQEALSKLYERAAANNISFNPMAAMLQGLLHHISTTEKRLLAAGESSVLKKFNIALNDQNKTDQYKETKRYVKKIFKKLQALKGGLESYSKTAREIYDNDTNLNSSTLLKYVEGTSKPSQWSISCALSTLGSHEDLSSIVPLSALLELWLIPLRFSGKLQTAEHALKFFKQTFKYANASEAELPIQQIMQKSL